MIKCKKGTALLLAFSLCASILAPNSADAAKVKKPVLSKKKLTLVRDKSATIRLKKAGKCKVTWSTSDKAICKITKKTKSSCKFKAVGNGSAKINCKVKKKGKSFKLSCNVKVKPKVVTNLPSIIKTYESQIPYMGTCLNYGNANFKRELQTRKTLDFVKSQFNSFTLENEMKPDNILGFRPTTMSVDEAKAQGYYIPENYKDSTVPKMNFREVDAALEVASKNGLKMRAHTLVWHSQTPSWFFSEKYENDKDTTKETMDAREDFYIHNVMAHVMDKEKALTGSAGSIVYAWDVVNEYLHRQAFGRTWTTIYGNTNSTPSYVKKAFEIAYAMLKSYEVQDKVTLFYNDFNTYFGIQQTLDLVNFINKDEPEKICGGIGMQSHVDVKVPTIELYGSALEKFLAAGYEVQITELDVTINFDTEGSSASYSYANEHETNAEQAKYIGQLMKTILEKNRNRDKNVNPKGVTSITLWGLYDAISWRASCAPLLFDTGITDPKASFYEFINAAKSMN
ncbi:MAG: endo-1,4-beta-xylanase [Eubacterium sp.]